MRLNYINYQLIADLSQAGIIYTSKDTLILAKSKMLHVLVYCN